MDFTLSTSGNMLYITPVSGWAYNTQYTITLDANISGFNPLDSGYYTMGSDYSWWFTGPYCPLFTTLTRIRLEAGPAADNITDDTIYRLILKNSQDAMDIAITAADGASVPYSFFGCTWENVPYILRRYVECKTAYDLLALIEMANNGVGGARAQFKTLGDMKIRYGGPSAYYQAVDPGRKKQLYDCWMEYLNGIKATGIKAAVRGWLDASKGYCHPTSEPHHNRVVRSVDFRNSHPAGPWVRGRYWRGWV